MDHPCIRRSGGCPMPWRHPFWDILGAGEEPALGRPRRAVPLGVRGVAPALSCCRLDTEPTRLHTGDKRRLRWAGAALDEGKDG